jgi:hypothetical protein
VLLGIAGVAEVLVPPALLDCSPGSWPEHGDVGNVPGGDLV